MTPAVPKSHQSHSVVTGGGRMLGPFGGAPAPASGFAAPVPGKGLAIDASSNGRTVTTAVAPLTKPPTEGLAPDNWPQSAAPGPDYPSLALMTQLCNASPDSTDSGMLAHVMLSLEQAAATAGTAFPTLPTRVDFAYAPHTALTQNKQAAAGQGASPRRRSLAPHFSPIPEGDEDGQHQEGSLEDGEATDLGGSSSQEGAGRGGAQRMAPRAVGRPLSFPSDPSDRSLTEDERRRVKRRVANRESARRVRQKRQELMEDLQERTTVLSQENAQLMAQIANMQQNRQYMYSVMYLARDRFAATEAENKRLLDDSQALRKTLRECGINPDVLVRPVPATQPPTGDRVQPPPAGPFPNSDVKAAGLRLHAHGSAFHIPGTGGHSAFAPVPLPSTPPSPANQALAGVAPPLPALAR